MENKEEKYQQVIEKMLRCGDGKLCDECRENAIMLISPEKNEHEELEIELDKELLLQLCLKAHEKDITLNQLICDIISWYAEEEELKGYV